MDKQERIESYVIERIAKDIELGVYRGDWDVLDDDLNEYIPVSWELKLEIDYGTQECVSKETDELNKYLDNLNEVIVDFAYENYCKHYRAMPTSSLRRYVSTQIDKHNLGIINMCIRRMQYERANKEW